MWYCEACGAKNEGNSRFCVECGRPRGEETSSPGRTEPTEWGPAHGAPGGQPADPGWTASAPVPPAAAAWTPPAPPPKKKSRWWIWLLVALVVLAAAAVTCYFTVHIWSPATCTEAKVCKICGKTSGMPLGHAPSEATCTDPSVCIRCGIQMGDALGHDPTDATCTDPSVCARCGETLSPALGHVPTEATCTEPSVCTRCGETLSPALGHDWVPATYDEPETCARCGMVRGEVKGFIGDLDGTVSSENINLFGYNQAHPYELDVTVHNCLKLTLGLKLTSVSGNPYGEWGLYGRGLDGKWVQMDKFYVPSGTLNTWQTFDFDLGGKYTFDALAMLPLSGAQYSISFSFYFENAQEYLG